MTTASRDEPASRRHDSERHPDLRLCRMDINAHREPILFLRRDVGVARSEGFDAAQQVAVEAGGRRIVCTLHLVGASFLEEDQVGLSDAAWERLGAEEGTPVRLSHVAPPDSLRYVRAKLRGGRLDREDFAAVLRDIVDGRYAAAHIAAFLAACAGHRLERREMLDLTHAMVQTGERLKWDDPIVMDKHCIGGLPGNRTTPIIVPIVAAAGLRIPKTSSRAITSPSGTADTVATFTEVDLDLATMRRVVADIGGCMAWGGAVHLSPADDMIIRVERMLELDSEAQLVASILSKKAAAGATHVLIDLPVGPTAKIRSPEAADLLERLLVDVGRELGMTIAVVQTDGLQPVGRGIGPALEARDVLQVLRGDPHAPKDLRDRALMLAGRALELGGNAPKATGKAVAKSLLDDGTAYERFLMICEAQGGFRDPRESKYHIPHRADHAGQVVRFDNVGLARIAKLAGAPDAPAAGLDLHVRLGDEVQTGQPLFTIHAESRGEFHYAQEYLERVGPIIEIGPA